MGLETHRAVGPFISKQEFVADPDVPIYFRVTELMILWPIVRKRDCGFIDATGEFDICFDETMEQMMFVSRRPGRETFAYRFVSSYFPKSAFKG
jgi:hypothetical protein